MTPTLTTISNDGPRITDTNYWQSEHAARGFFYLSINAGAFRLLVPPTQAAILRELESATDVVVSRGPWPAEQRHDAFEIVFDDGSPSPFAIHLLTTQVDRLPRDADTGSRWICSVWTECDGRTVEVLSRPATYRRSRRLPDLRPATP